ncbi:MAG: hypothetical protein E6J15_09525 [Chloroflexi bacterium]|nr:MAG: hypothetical protein E6J15_09525 [Chloroflexota bacterium]
MRRRLRFDPLYALAGFLLLVVVVLAIFVGTNAQSQGRSGSALDGTSGGTARFRGLVEGLGAETVIVQGDRFSPRDTGVSVLFMLGATEFVSDADAVAVKTFLQGGGTLVLATDLGLAESAVLRTYGVGMGEGTSAARFDASSVIAATAGAAQISIDRGRILTLSDRWSPVLRSEGRTLAAMTRDGAGTLIVVGSLAPFINQFLSVADNGRFALSLAAAGFGSGRSIGFDEYHHGAHPSAELMAVLERTWLGRAMLLAGALVFVYLWWSGRRFGAPLPADPRPPRSSLEYIRGFAGLLRRSGRDEIARERLRRDLRLGLATRYGLDPATPLDRILVTAEADDPLIAVEARATDAALASRLRDNELLRTVARIERLVAKKERP